jgi:hypothetical protein
MKKVISIGKDAVEVEHGNDGSKGAEKALLLSMDILEILDGEDANISFNAIALVLAHIFKENDIPQYEAGEALDSTKVAILNIAYQLGEESAVQ